MNSRSWFELSTNALSPPGADVTGVGLGPSGANGVRSSFAHTAGGGSSNSICLRRLLWPTTDTSS
jgi:hypothetical protein